MDEQSHVDMITGDNVVFKTKNAESTGLMERPAEGNDFSKLKLLRAWQLSFSSVLAGACKRKAANVYFSY